MARGYSRRGIDTTSEICCRPGIWRGSQPFNGLQSVTTNTGGVAGWRRWLQSRPALFPSAPGSYVCREMAEKYSMARGSEANET